MATSNSLQAESGIPTLQRRPAWGVQAGSRFRHGGQIHLADRIKRGIDGVEISTSSGRKIQFSLADRVETATYPYPVLAAGQLKKGDRIRTVRNQLTGAVRESYSRVKRVEPHGDAVTIVFDSGDAITLPRSQVVRLAEED